MKIELVQLELELIQSHILQKPVLRGEVDALALPGLVMSLVVVQASAVNPMRLGDGVVVLCGR